MSAGNTDHAKAPAYALAAAVRDVRYHSVASLTFLVWHSALSLHEDVEYIWAMRNKNVFKWIYFFLRYIAILAHVMHNILMELLANGKNPPMLCRMWYAYILAFTQILETLLELIMASRVLALYNRSRRIALLLSIPIMSEVAGTVRLLCAVPTVDFYGTCLLVRPSEGGREQCILGFAVQCMLIGLTLFKYVFARRAGWARTPLVSLVIRDGSTVYATTFFILVSVVTIWGLENERSVAVFFWATSLYSISGCRLILNMERLARGEISTESSQPVFTSGISLDALHSGVRHDRATL